jgi:hypothetical protein
VSLKWQRAHIIVFRLATGEWEFFRPFELHCDLLTLFINTPNEIWFSLQTSSKLFACTYAAVNYKIMQVKQRKLASQKGSIFKSVTKLEHRWSLDMATTLVGDDRGTICPEYFPWYNGLFCLDSLQHLKRPVQHSS